MVERRGGAVAAGREWFFRLPGWLFFDAGLFFRDSFFGGLFFCFEFDRQALVALDAGVVALEFFEPAEKGAFGRGFVAEGQGVFFVLAFGPGAEEQVLGVVDFVEAALVALKIPLGMRGLLDKYAFGRILRIVLAEPALNKRGIFGGIFAVEDDLRGAAAVCEPVE